MQRLGVTRQCVWTHPMERPHEQDTSSPSMCEIRKSILFRVRSKHAGRIASNIGRHIHNGRKTFASKSRAFETVDWEFGAERDRLLREALQKSSHMRQRSRSKWRRIASEFLNAGQVWIHARPAAQTHYIVIQCAFRCVFDLHHQNTAQPMLR